MSDEQTLSKILLLQEILQGLRKNDSTLSAAELRGIADLCLGGTDYADLLIAFRGQNWRELEVKLKVATELQRDLALVSLASDEKTNRESLQEQALLALLLRGLQSHVGRQILLMGREEL